MDAERIRRRLPDYFKVIKEPWHIAATLLSDFVDDEESLLGPPDAHARNLFHVAKAIDEELDTIKKWAQAQHDADGDALKRQEARLAQERESWLAYGEKMKREAELAKKVRDARGAIMNQEQQAWSAEREYLRSKLYAAEAEIERRAGEAMRAGYSQGVENTEARAVRRIDELEAEIKARDAREARIVAALTEIASQNRCCGDHCGCCSYRDDKYCCEDLALMALGLPPLRPLED